MARRSARLVGANEVSLEELHAVAVRRGRGRVRVPVRAPPVVMEEPIDQEVDHATEEVGVEDRAPVGGGDLPILSTPVPPEDAPLTSEDMRRFMLGLTDVLERVVSSTPPPRGHDQGGYPVTHARVDLSQKRNLDTFTHGQTSPDGALPEPVRELLGASRVCYNCRRPDHMAKDCGVRRVCFSCGGPDHIARDCGHQRARYCFICGSPYHLSAQYVQQQQRDGGDVVQRSTQQAGQIAGQIPPAGRGNENRGQGQMGALPSQQDAYRRAQAGRGQVSGRSYTMTSEEAEARDDMGDSSGGPDCGEKVTLESYDQAPDLSFWDRLGNAALLDVESDDFCWDSLLSLLHTKHSTSAENSEDELNKALEVTVNSGGVVFYALFKNTLTNVDLPPREAAAVIKFASSRMATQSERLGYEFAKWLGVRTPLARVIHNSSSEWQQIKDAAHKARDVAVSNGDEVGELSCSELLEALESSRCLFLMTYVHGMPLLENSEAFDSQRAAETTASALGRVLMLDLILRNEDRLPCRQLGWRGNSANLLFADTVTSSFMDAMEEAYDSAIRRYKPKIIKSLQRERRAISINGRLGSDNPEHDLSSYRSKRKQATNAIKHRDFHVVTIDSGVPRRPPAGKRAQDQENYPKVVELLLNNSECCSNLLYEVSGGKLGFPKLDECVSPSYSSPWDSCSVSDVDMASVVNEFRGGFRAALRDLQGFHIFLLTLHQKLDALLRLFLPILSKSSGEFDREDFGPSESPRQSNVTSSNSSFIGCKESNIGEGNPDSGDIDMQKLSKRLLRAVSRESIDSSSPISRENWNGKYFKGSGDSRCLRMTMKLRDFNKFAKIDSELNKELEQWNELLRTDIVRLCQENNFNTGFFEGSDNHIVVDAYEFKVRLEHILERIGLISDAASTERPSPITEYLYIGGALSARSMYTLQHLGITHVLCLCSNEIGQSEFQYPELFEYRNFSIDDSEDEDISDLFDEASDFIDYVEYLGGKVLVHCFEGKSRSATIVLAYLMMRRRRTLLEAWNMLKKVHRRAHPNDGFARILTNLDKSIHGKVSMEWQQRRPVMKVCPICGKNVGLSSSSLKLHLQKSHRKISSGSVDSAMKLEIQKAIEALKISRGGSVSPTQKQSQSFMDGFSH